MGLDPVPQIIVAVVALILSGFFTLLKYSYDYMNKYKLERMLEDEHITDREQREVERLIDVINEVQITFMISDYLANAFVAASLAYVGFYYYRFIGAVIAVFIAGILILVFGETAPYFISLSKGDMLAVKFRIFARIYTRISSPIILIIRSISKLIGSLFGTQRDAEVPKITEDELFTAMNLSKDEGLLELDEYSIIEKVFAFSDNFVKDVMTPRTDVVYLNVNSTPEEIFNVFTEEGYSRIPVYEEDIDNILGILHVKDLIKLYVSKEDKELREILRKPMHTFEYQKSSDLFNQMRKNKQTFAVVLDEYGGTDGIVTMEDLIEEIVGDIEDEYDDVDEYDEIMPLKNNMYIVDGSCRIEDLRKRLNLDIYSDEVDTVGGFVFEKIDRIPEQGEVLEFENLVFTVLELEKNRISKLKLQIK